MRLWSKKDRWLVVVLVASVLLVFFGALRNNFIGYDDPLYVTGNSRVQNGLTWDGILWAFSTGTAANWHPLTWISHMMDVQLFGVKPWGHHLVSIVIHAFNTALLFRLFLGLTCLRARSFLIAALFGLHPLRVESVAWVSERKDVLSAMFWMLTLLAYHKYASFSDHGPKSSAGVASPMQTIRGAKNVYYAMAVLFFIGGLMSKPMVVTLPFVLLLLDYWPLKRLGWGNSKVSARFLALEKLPFFGLSAAASIATFLVQKSGNAIIIEANLPTRLANAFVSYARYLAKIFWPAHLSAFYPAVQSWPAAVVLFSGALVAGCSLVAILCRRSRPWFSVGWFWFLGTLVPVIGVVQAGEQSMADRYSYLPSIGIFLIFVWACFELADKWPARQLSSKKLMIGVFVTLVLLYAGATSNQIRFWKNTETLFAHAAQVTEKNYLAYNNIGVALEKEGHLDEAIVAFERSLTAKPDYAEAHNNLGVALEKSGRFQEALTHLEKASKLKRNYAEPYENLGVLLQELGRNDESMKAYQMALQIQPDNVDAHVNLGAAYGRAGKTSRAILEFQKVIELDPYSADAQNNLGVAFDKEGKLDQAIEHFQMAIKLNPSYARAHFNLGGTLTRKGNLDEAIFEFREALRFQPEYGAAQTNLNSLLQIKRSAQGQ